MAAYNQKNSKGQTYYLHSRNVVLKGGRPQTIYFFAKEEKSEGGLAQIPAAYEVSENKRTGLLFLRKKQ
ncbi:MAG: hypothetical protein ACOZAR_04640 [Patescibacteria group bacterium]